MGIRLRDLPVWVRLVASIWLTIVVAWAGLLTWAAQQEKITAIAQAKDFAVSVHQMTLAGLTGMMITGTISQRAIFLDQIKHSNHIDALTVIRGEPVMRQFGPGFAQERPSDQAEMQVLLTGIPHFDIRGEGKNERMRAILPAIALTSYLGKNCLECHQVAAGAILGAVSMEIALDKVNEAVATFQQKVYFTGFLLSLPLALFIYLYISRIVTRPLKQVTEGLNKIAAGTIESSRRLDTTSGDEIGSAAAAFNRVMDKAYELIDSQRMAKAVFDNSLEGIMICDRHNRIQMVNPAFTHTTGYAAEEAIGQTPALLKSGQHDDAFYQTFWQSLSKNGEWQGEIWNKRKNGEIYPEWLNISVVKNQAGEVEHYIAILSDISERKRNEEIIAFQAHHDALTGLPNRTLFRDRLDQALAMARRQSNRVGVMFLDLDRFKLINDTLGHDVGDELLKKVSSRLLSCIRESDTVARQGGDEFTVLLPKVNHPQDVVAVGSKILAAMKQPFTLKDQDLFVTTSIGISLFPDDGRDADTLMKHADTAMYFVKSEGRAGMYMFTESLLNQPSRRLELQSQLHNALAREEFTVYYQPQIDLVSNRIYGTEALIRWQHPTLGLVTPENFIPLSEETGLIVPIGAWVIQTACMQAKAWENQGHSLTMAVNLSPRQFHREDIVRTVKKALDSSGLAAHKLELEITESLAMQDVEYSIRTLHALANLGVQLAIDDFGTGYSSLSYLKKMPVNTLKVDRIFVRDLVSDVDDRAIISAVISLAHSLGLKVVAEGVETQDHLDLLREMGCDNAQGYLFSRPEPQERISDLFIAPN
jgi:diguanylate cyclase (GGDEF)-like protein/PAS domain S-box-containing protein